jgi:hypothetical protein
MSGEGKGKDGGGIRTQTTTNPFAPPPLRPSQPTVIPDPFPTNPAPLITTTPSIAPVPITLTQIVTITEENPSLSAQSTVRPKNAATVISTIIVTDAQTNDKHLSTINIAAIIFAILVGLVIVGGSMAILIRRKFSENKGNKKNQSQPPSIDENVHNNNVPNAELFESISDDNQQMLQRNSFIYFHPQFPIPPPRHPPPQTPLPPVDLYMNSPTRHYSSGPPLSEHSAYAGTIPIQYQRYSQLPFQTATDVISSHSEQSQSSSTEMSE